MPTTTRTLQPSARTRTSGWTGAGRGSFRGDFATVGIFVATRLLDAVFIVLAAPRQAPLSSMPPSYHVTVPPQSPAGYLDVVTNWDAQWYWDIVVHGYPTSAVDAAGQPAQTSLAFYPLYPMLARVGTTLTGLDFRVVAPFLSLVLGAMAFVVLYRLLRQVVDPRRAFLGLTVLSCFVSAPALQIAYTESLALFLLAAALLFLRNGAYGGAVVTVLLLGLTRNISLALAPVVLVHWLAAARAADRGEREPMSPRERLGCAALLVATVVAAAEWPLLAGVVTDEPGAYLTTMKAWPGYSPSVLSPPWLEFTQSAGVLVFGLATLAVVLFAGLMITPRARQWGPELWAWSWAYPAYLFATVAVTTSVLRYLLLCFPLGLWLVPAADSAASRRIRAATVMVVCITGLASQWWWINHVLVLPSSVNGVTFP